MSNSIVPYSDIERMGAAITKSGLFGVKTQDQAVALMLVAQSEGLHPARAAMEYHVIQGRPALKADAMLARFQSAGGKVEWKDYTDEKVSGVFSHPQGGSVTIDWTIERAKQAGVYGKNPTWKSYPRPMLRSRCISEGIRTVYPGVSVGVYTPEEVQDFEEKDVTPEKEQKPVPMPQKVKDMAAALKEPKPKTSTPIQPVVIEGEASRMPEDALEKQFNASKPKPADEETIRKLVKAFFDIGIDMDALEAKIGKSIDDLTDADIAKAKALYKTEKEAFLASQTAGEDI